MAKKIGFIGLGHMGLPMAKNLCRAGFPVFVCSSRSESQRAVIEVGGGVIDSYQTMAAECDVIITIVPADKEVRSLYKGEDGILTNARPGLTCIDMTSAKGTTKQAIAEYITSIGKDVTFIDAPVSGGVSGAAAGTLTIMAGGKKEAIEEQMDIFGILGKKIIHTGDVGSGSNIKMLNQMLNAANTAIAAEVLCMARILHVDDSVLCEVVNTSSGGSYVFERNVPKYMMTGDHKPGFKLDLMKKDVGLFVDSAKEFEEFIPVSELVYQAFCAASNQGYGELNYTAIHEWLKENQRQEEKV